MAVEQWLKMLSFENGDPLAKGSKAKIRNIMSALYSHAIRWEWATGNPITSVRQSAKRQSAPEVLTVDELVRLLSTIPELLRHATLKVTMDTYVQAVSDERRKAQSKVVDMLLPGIRRAVR